MKVCNDAANIFLWQMGKEIDEDIEVSIDGENWFDPVEEPDAGNDLYYRVKAKPEFKDKI